MACFCPLAAWQTEGGEVVFTERGSIRRSLTLPCGQCLGCRLERSRQWAVRCMHEAQMHEMSSFVTLTYADEECPGSLRYRDFQLFMKRLRKKYGKVRFFMCGEYGEQFSRPHFHACLFGVHFGDRVVHSTSGSGSTLYRSAFLESIWTHGFSSIGDVNFESAAYVARYVVKKVTGDRAQEHYEKVSLSTGELVQVQPEFCQMSRRPGIGATWFEKFAGEVFNRSSDGVRIYSQKQPAPRFYFKKLKEVNWDLYEDLEKRRYDAITPESVLENEPGRLKVRAEVVAARLAFKVRTLG